ncbi:MAG: nucleotidyltransferase [Balneolaceae bacterium]
MSISETQLSTWAHQGSITQSAKTYDSIKNCIDNISWKDDVSYDIYLQGSYKNSTNVRGDSDVDLVVEFTSVFYSNKKQLPPDQLQEFNDYHSDGKYKLSAFRDSVLKRLKEHYGEHNIEIGSKSIKVIGNSGRLDCDVVCCAQYREYRSFSKINTSDYNRGIVFWTNNSEREKVVNFPKSHYENGVDKQSRCNSNYKSSVRIFKNLKQKLVERGLLDADIAPSYFLECLLFNINDSVYKSTTFQNRIQSILQELEKYSKEDLEKFVCQNYQRYLFGASDQQWSIDSFIKVRDGLLKYWDEN